MHLEVGQVVYIPGAADLRKGEIQESHAADKEQGIIEYIKIHGSISMKEATELCGYKARSATRKIIDNMQEKQLIEKIGNGPKTRYKLKSDL